MGNVVLITVDSLRADHVGWHGYGRPTTPNLDQLAESAHVFENAFAQAGATRASFPSLLSSVYALMYGGSDHISEEQRLVSEVLHERGYRTAGFHSNPYLSADFGYDRGFDTFFDTTSEATLLSHLRHLVKRRLPSESIIYKGLQTVFNTTESAVGVDIGAAYLDATTVTDRAIEWIESTTPTDAHFLWIHYMDVHHPYIPPKRYQQHFRADPIDDRRAIRLRRQMLDDPSAITETEHQDILDLYDAEIRYVDAEINRLMRSLHRHWEQPTTTLFTSDHGEEFKDHGAYSHGTLHDEGIHVPFLLNDASQGTNHEELIGLIDVPPTIAELADAPIPDNWHGRSLIPLLHGTDWDRNAILGNWGDLDSDTQTFYYRTHEWKYITDGEDGQLYYLPDDPDEQENVAAENPGTVAEISDRIDSHRTEVEDTHWDIGSIEIDAETADRLEKLGYR